MKSLLVPSASLLFAIASMATLCMLYCLVSHCVLGAAPQYALRQLCCMALFRSNAADKLLTVMHQKTRGMQAVLAITALFHHPWSVSTSKTAAPFMPLQLLPGCFPSPTLPPLPKLSCNSCQEHSQCLCESLQMPPACCSIAQTISPITLLKALLLQTIPPVQVLAEVLGAEAALGRIQFVSGTHAIATALYSVLRPGDELLAVAGRHVCVCSTECAACCLHYMFCLPACICLAGWRSVLVCILSARLARCGCIS